VVGGTPRGRSQLHQPADRYLGQGGEDNNISRTDLPHGAGLHGGKQPRSAAGFRLRGSSPIRRTAWVGKSGSPALVAPESRAAVAVFPGGFHALGNRCAGFRLRAILMARTMRVTGAVASHARRLSILRLSMSKRLRYRQAGITRCRSHRSGKSSTPSNLETR